MRRFLSIILATIISLSTLCSVVFAESNYDSYRAEVDKLNRMSIPIQPQRYHVVKSGSNYVSADSQGSGGICNVVAGTQLLNRRIAYDKNGTFSNSDFFTLEEVMMANGVEISEREVPYKKGNTGYVYTGGTGSWYYKTYTKNGTTYKIAMKNSDSVKNDMASKGVTNFEDYLASILIAHPEGLCYYKNGHYIVITDYVYNKSNGQYTFYAIDGTNEIINGYKKGRVEFTETSLCKDNGVKSIRGNVGLIAYIDAPSKPIHTCTQYETYKSGNTKVLGACKECHKAYNWQDTFSRVSNQTASLKSSKKNYKISVYNAPYEDATKTTAKSAISKFAIVGTVKNAYGNEWYAIDYPDDVKKVCYTAYIYKSTLTDNYDIVTTTVQQAKKYDSANVSTKKHTHNYNYDNGRCYCGEQKQISQKIYEESTLKLNLTKYPVQHTHGNNFGLRGTISSNYNIKKIYGYIKQNGNVIQSTEDTPNSKSVDVKKQNLNNNLIFDRLSPGNYTLEVQAVDASGNSVRVSKDFTIVAKVVKAESTLSINLEKYPVTITSGNGFGLRGSVSSNYSISVVKGYVIDSNGNTKLSSKDTPYSTYMDIQPAKLNNDLIFNNLSAGNYTLKVVATDSSGKTVEVSKNFSVVSPEKNNSSTLSVNLDRYPVKLDVNTHFGLRGNVSSNYNISVVRGFVYDSNGQTKLSSKDTPNSTYMDIQYANLNEDLIFNNLSAGNYTMKVVAVDASGRTVEVSKNFTVKAKAAYVDDSPNGNGVTGTVDIPSSWENLSIRTGPSTSYEIIGSMNDGVKCTVYPNKTSNGWYYVNYNGIWGYASGKQINLNSSSATNTRVGIINIPSDWTDLSIRTGPSTNYQIVGGMPHGARCTVYPDKASNGWYYVEYNGVRGYAAGNRINLQ